VPSVARERAPAPAANGRSPGQPKGPSPRRSPGPSQRMVTTREQSQQQPANATADHGVPRSPDVVAAVGPVPLDQRVDHPEQATARVIAASYVRPDAAPRRGMGARVGHEEVDSARRASADRSPRCAENPQHAPGRKAAPPPAPRLLRRTRCSTAPWLARWPQPAGPREQPRPTARFTASRQQLGTCSGSGGR